MEEKSESMRLNPLQAIDSSFCAFPRLEAILKLTWRRLYLLAFIIQPQNLLCTRSPIQGEVSVNAVPTAPIPRELRCQPPVTADIVGREKVAPAGWLSHLLWQGGFRHPAMVWTQGCVKWVKTLSMANSDD